MMITRISTTESADKLIDELTAVGDQRFRDKYHKAFMDRRSRSTVVMVSHQPTTIQEFCDMVAILFDGQISLYNSVQDGMNAYQEKLASVERIA